ncbi:MAG TPA: NAD(P)H-dependent oxidoreductase subunit E [Anaerolineaceae bacterium]|nr:NAD(P)H-dependent oxidoreductase subunit E [Anaerolineaceae bacterium]
MNELLNKYPQEVERIVAKYPAENRQAAVMPLLYLAQRDENYLSKKAIQDIAEITGLSSTDVDSVAGFYTLFHEEPGGRYRLQVCTDLPCALRGAEKFFRELCAALGVNPGETTSDGMFLVEEVKCLAACHRAPMMQVQGDGDIAYHEHLTVEKAMQVVEALRARGEAAREAK